MFDDSTATERTPEHLDVLIVGAGLSGIGAACHIAADHPAKSFAVLESREASGGTWDLFRYPGIRSDSDMFTLGYRFRPWPEAEAIADGPAILEYVRETAREHDVERRIRYHHRVVAAEWSSESARWRVEVERSDTGERVALSCGFLFSCAGYYRYDEGYTPELEGMERFRGPVIHPQHWPEDLDYEGKRVIVIGSGATAVTLVPAMADRAAQVTMLQRSPSYVVSLPKRDPLAVVLAKVLPKRALYPIVRWKNVLLMMLFFHFCRRAPGLARRLIRRGVLNHLPDRDAVDTHFDPLYEPWDQRVCLVPDGDLFESLKRGEASIATGEIETFTEAGIRLRSGEEIEADLIVTATGLNLQVLGGIELAVDGTAVEPSKTIGYKGMMLAGVPNLAMTLGYTNASWTLKADLVAEHVSRLLAHMDEHGYAICTPQAPDELEPTEPFIDLKAGYVLRSIDELPRQGTRWPWRLHQNYPLDVVLLRHSGVDDEGIEFASANGAGTGTPIAEAGPLRGSSHR